MPADAPFDSVNVVAKELPFGIDDTEAANEAFVQWRENGSTEARRLVNLWTYCFVRRYFLAKFLQRSYGGASDFEMLIEKVYRRVEDKRSTIKQPERYASWVSVVSRNTFLNYVRTDRHYVALEEDGGPTLLAEEETGSYDAGYAHHVVKQAIAELPPFLEEVAELYILHQRDYAAIGRTIDKSVPTVRAYVHRALKRLRNNDELMYALKPFGADKISE